MGEVELFTGLRAGFFLQSLRFIPDAETPNKLYSLIPKVLLALFRFPGNHPEQNYQRTTTTVDVRTILILGGYGNFGKRIASHLSQSAGLTPLIGGRDASKAASYAAVLQDKAAPDTRIEPCKIDYTAEDFPQRLSLLAPQLVIHTSGPFQGQDYRSSDALYTKRFAL